MRTPSRSSVARLESSAATAVQSGVPPLWALFSKTSPQSGGHSHLAPFFMASRHSSKWLCDSVPYNTSLFREKQSRNCGALSQWELLNLVRFVGLLRIPGIATALLRGDLSHAHPG